MEDNILDGITDILNVYLEGLHNPREDSLYNELRAVRDTKELKRQIQALVEQQVLIGRKAELESIHYLINHNLGSKHVYQDRLAELDRQISKLTGEKNE